MKSIIFKDEMTNCQKYYNSSNIKYYLPKKDYDHKQFAWKYDNPPLNSWNRLSIYSAEWIIEIYVQCVPEKNETDIGVPHS